MKSNSKSNRNRHTGRVNAYKARLLEEGQPLRDSLNRPYRALQTGTRVFYPPGKPLEFKREVPVYTFVRDFQKEEERHV